MIVNSVGYIGVNVHVTGRYAPELQLANQHHQNKQRTAWALNVTCVPSLGILCRVRRYEPLGKRYLRVVSFWGLKEDSLRP